MYKLSINVHDALKAGYTITQHVTPMYETDAKGGFHHIGNSTTDVLRIESQDFIVFTNGWAESELHYGTNLTKKLEAQGIRTCAT